MNVTVAVHERYITTGADLCGHCCDGPADAMLRHLVLLSAVAACGCVRTRETVRRVVMVRTTGSDLQPAATGFVYDKRDDGPERVVAMRESDVVEHLAKLYTREPVAAARVIPVSEDQKDSVDGVADVDYEKIFADYRAGYGGSRAYDDYLEGLKGFKGGYEYADDDRGSEKHRPGTGGGNAGSYSNAKFESYSISGGHGKGHADGDAHKEGKDHAHRRGSEGGASDAEGDAPGFPGVSDKIHHKYDHDYFGKGVGAGFSDKIHHEYDHDFFGKGVESGVSDKSHHKNDHEHFGKGVEAFANGHNYNGAGDRGHAHRAHEPEHLDFKANPEASDDEASHEERSANLSSEAPASAAEAPSGGSAERNSYGYKIEH